jgi:hypothetical protein
MFTLVIDDFSIHYEGKQHAQHLIAALKQDYEAITTGWNRNHPLLHYAWLGLQGAIGQAMSKKQCESFSTWSQQNQSISRITTTNHNMG